MAWYTLISGDVWVSVFFSNFLYENSGLNVSFSVDLMLQGKKGVLGFGNLSKNGDTSTLMITCILLMYNSIPGLVFTGFCGILLKYYSVCFTTGHFCLTSSEINHSFSMMR